MFAAGQDHLKEADAGTALGVGVLDARVVLVQHFEGLEETKNPTISRQ